MARRVRPHSRRELADLGVTLKFCAVVDLRRSRGRNPFDFNSLIAAAPFRRSSDRSRDRGGLCTRLETSGVGATVKHFPGMGRVQADTHHFRASLDTPLPELEASTDSVSGSAGALERGADGRPRRRSPQSIPDGPASHAKGVIDGLIRKKWGFRDWIVTTTW